MGLVAGIQASLRFWGGQTLVCIREGSSPPLSTSLFSSLLHDHSFHKQELLLRLLPSLLSDLDTENQQTLLNQYTNTFSTTTTTHKHSQWVPSYLASKPSSGPSAPSSWPLSAASATCSPRSLTASSPSSASSSVA